MEAAGFVSVSLEDLEDKIIAYFARRFRTSPTTIFATTDLKQRFNFTNAAWAGLADTFSSFEWMTRIHVRLAQPEMGAATTVEKLANLIWKKVPKLVALTSTATAVASLFGKRKMKTRKKRPVRKATTRTPSKKGAGKQRKDR